MARLSASCLHRCVVHRGGWTKYPTETMKYHRYVHVPGRHSLAHNRTRIVAAIDVRVGGPRATVSGGSKHRGGGDEEVPLSRGRGVRPPCSWRNPCIRRGGCSKYVIQRRVEGTTPLLRGTIANRTYVTHKNLYISLFLQTIFGPINYGPP